MEESKPRTPQYEVKLKVREYLQKISNVKRITEKMVIDTSKDLLKTMKGQVRRQVIEKLLANVKILNPTEQEINNLAGAMEKNKDNMIIKYRIRGKDIEVPRIRFPTMLNAMDVFLKGETDFTQIKLSRKKVLKSGRTSAKSRVGNRDYPMLQLVGQLESNPYAKYLVTEARKPVWLVEMLSPLELLNEHSHAIARSRAEPSELETLDQIEASRHGVDPGKLSAFIESHILQGIQRAKAMNEGDFDETEQIILRKLYTYLRKNGLQEPKIQHVQYAYDNIVKKVRNQIKYNHMRDQLSKLNPPVRLEDLSDDIKTMLLYNASTPKDTKKIILPGGRELPKLRSYKAIGALTIIKTFLNGTKYGELADVLAGKRIAGAAANSSEAKASRRMQDSRKAPGRGKKSMMSDSEEEEEEAEESDSEEEKEEPEESDSEDEEEEPEEEKSDEESDEEEDSLHESGVAGAIGEGGMAIDESDQLVNYSGPYTVVPKQDKSSEEPSQLFAEPQGEASALFSESESDSEKPDPVSVESTAGLQGVKGMDIEGPEPPEAHNEAGPQGLFIAHSQEQAKSRFAQLVPTANAEKESSKRFKDKLSTLARPEAIEWAEELFIRLDEAKGEILQLQTGLVQPAPETIALKHKRANKCVAMVLADIFLLVAELVNDGDKEGLKAIVPETLCYEPKFIRAQLQEKGKELVRITQESLFAQREEQDRDHQIFYASLLESVMGALNEIYHRFSYVNFSIEKFPIPTFRNQDVMELELVLADLMAFYSGKEEPITFLCNLVDPNKLRKESSYDPDHEHIKSFSDFFYLAQLNTAVNMQSEYAPYMDHMRGYKPVNPSDIFRAKEESDAEKRLSRLSDSARRPFKPVTFDDFLRDYSEVLEQRAKKRARKKAMNAILVNGGYGRTPLERFMASGEAESKNGSKRHRPPHE